VSSADARILGEDSVRADQDAYKQLATLAARGVAVVTAVRGRWDVAATVTDFLSVSYDPPTMVVSLFSLSRIAEAVTASGRFAISLLARDQRGIADRLGAPGAPLVGLLDQVPHTRREPGAPIVVDGSLAWFELRVVATQDAATHVLIVGEVTATSAAARWGARPLVRWRSEYE